jgi:hypothetical protein
VLGDEHLVTTVDYLSLAMNLEHQKQYAEAEPLRRRLVEIHRKVHSDENAETVLSWSLLAANLMNAARAGIVPGDVLLSSAGTALTKNDDLGAVFWRKEQVAIPITVWRAGQVCELSTALLMVRFYQNLLGRREGLKGPCPKAEALAEAKNWLRGLDATEAEKLLRDTRLNRGERTVKTAPAENAAHPFEHPYYWAAFVLVGDPK